MHAQPEEIQALARVVARRGGIYATHMRSESEGLLDAIRETLDVARATGVRLEISHLKTSGRRNWGLLDAALELIRTAQGEGIDVAADRYPYTAACTDLDVVFPAWAAEGGRERVLSRLRNPETRRRLREDLLADREPGYWDTVTIGSTTHPDNLRFRGLRLPEVATALGVEPVDALLHLTDTDALQTGAFFFGMSEENMLRILEEPWVMIGSDASIRAPTGPLSRDYPHPRAYGTFPRFLRMSLNGQTVPVEEAIRKMTSLPADHFRLRGRGRIAPGMAADLVVFDPVRVRDRATYGAPHVFAEGIETVVVNGTVTVRNGQITGDRAGMVLSR
jgi:N-acyl-D-amino-acid deacylase